MLYKLGSSWWQLFNIVVCMRYIHIYACILQLHEHIFLFFKVRINDQIISNLHSFALIKRYGSRIARYTYIYEFMSTNLGITSRFAWHTWLWITRIYRKKPTTKWNIKTRNLKKLSLNEKFTYAYNRFFTIKLRRRKSFGMSGDGKLWCIWVNSFNVLNTGLDPIKQGSWFHRLLASLVHLDIWQVYFLLRNSRIPLYLRTQFNCLYFLIFIRTRQTLVLGTIHSNHLHEWMGVSSFKYKLKLRF